MFALVLGAVAAICTLLSMCVLQHGTVTDDVGKRSGKSGVGQPALSFDPRKRVCIGGEWPRWVAAPPCPFLKATTCALTIAPAACICCYLPAPTVIHRHMSHIARLFQSVYFGQMGMHASRSR